MNSELTTSKDDPCCTPATTDEQSESKSWVRPHYELDRNDEAFRLRVYVPGSNKSNVEISITDAVLSLTAKRTDTAAQGWKPLSRELDRRDYRLEVRVPEKVDVAVIKAAVEDGILLLTLPISEAQKPRSIEVN
jgi:HSP20 family protein